ncbi:hypothetical protein [Coralloluteibacterium stylophorae]|uniref:Uncharacterized protein n=2 Tax=Coralloluteibacterium stylophorae TaxID=1776034 RepID=A0A8J7VST9_9GAMM|nr:hypothetical protein [Coralloluteibacterium stylophorae]MBS7456832.1 hypothetical protein [Coralloluteibacterium stylophorae]
MHRARIIYSRVGDWLIRAAVVAAGLVALMVLLALLGMIDKESLRTPATICYIGILLLSLSWLAVEVVQLLHLDRRHLMRPIETISERIEAQAKEDDQFIGKLASIPAQKLRECRARIEYQIGNIAQRATAVAAIVSVLGLLPKAFPIFSEQTSLGSLSLQHIAASMAVGAGVGVVVFSLAKPKLARLAFVLKLAEDRLGEAASSPPLARIN